MTAKSDGNDKSKKMRTKSAFDPVEAALRQLYDDVAGEEIPDDFMNLLDRLDGSDEKVDRK
ncbi:MAG: NepR family anti-sigma factor [Sphingorhabdus sp.]